MYPIGLLTISYLVIGDCDDVDFCELGETMYDVLLDGEVIKEDK